MYTAGIFVVQDSGRKMSLLYSLLVVAEGGMEGSPSVEGGMAGLTIC